MTVIALDVGGSSIKSGVVGEGLRPIDEVSVTAVDHAGPADLLVGQFALAIRSAAAGAGTPVERVAIAVPDPFDHVHGVSLMEHKFAALYGLALAPAIVGELTDAAPEIRWSNDAAAAVTGEALAGAGAGYRRVLGLTLGTGLGAALVVDGALTREAGGVVVGELWRRPTAAGPTADEAFAAGALLGRLDSDPAEGGDRFGGELAALLAPIVEAVSADVVVIGGGGAGSFDEFAPALRAALPAPCVAARLGRWAALLGAAHLCYGSEAPTGVYGRRP